MKLAAALLLLLATAPFAGARPGDTDQDLMNRYGNPVDVSDRNGKVVAKFRLQGTDIEATLLNGVCQEEICNNPGTFSEADMQAVLDANRGSEIWTQIRRIHGAMEWRLSDGTLLAFYDPDIKKLTLRRIRERMNPASKPPSMPGSTPRPPFQSNPTPTPIKYPHKIHMPKKSTPSPGGGGAEVIGG